MTIAIQYDAGGGVTLYPIVAPALILVGVMMMQSVRDIAWDDFTEALPSFLVIIVMPLAFSITDGIAFEGVSFAYPGSDRLVLDDVDLRLPAGSVVALVGENGAGKTTLVKLLCRFYEPTSGRVTVDGTDQRLPLKEFELLEMFLRNQGRVLTRGQLIDRVWGSDYVGDTKTLDVHVKRLRAKLEPDPGDPKYLVTVRGLGYKLDL